MEITPPSSLPALVPDPFADPASGPLAEPPPGTHPHAVEAAGWLLEGRFFTVDTGGAITMWSPPAAEAFAWSRLDIVRSRFSDVLLAPASREAHAERLGKLLEGTPDASTFRAEAVAVDANGERMRVAFSAVPIHVGVGYEFNALLQEIASSSQTARSLEQLKARGDSVLALIDGAVKGRHAELAESADAQRLAGALVVFRVLERSAPAAADGEAPVVGGIEAELADALRDAEESRARAESARSRVEEAIAESDRLRGELAEAQRRAAADVERSREALARAREEARADAKRHEAELRATREQHAAEAERLLSELSRARETATATAERLTQEVAAAHAEAEEAARELTAAQRDLTAARAELARRGDELEVLRASDGALRDELRILRADAAQARALAERASAELEGARRAAAAHPAAGGEEAAAARAADARVEDARAAAKAAEKETREAHAEAERLAAELAEAARESGRLAAEAEAAQARDAALQAELSALADATAEARAQADHAAAELEHTRAELERARAAREAGAASASDELARRDGELGVVRAELNGVRTELQAARGSVERLEAERDATRTDAERAASETREEIARLKQELDDARAALAAARATPAVLPLAKSRPAEPAASDAARPPRMAKERASRYLDFVLEVEDVPAEVAAPKKREPIALEALVEMAREVDSKNPYNRRHSERVAGYAAALAEALGFERPRIEAIRQVALVHDVGKSEIGEAIVAKDDPLNLEELDAEARHSDIGRDLLVAAGEPKLAEWVRHVHERYDGGGHPLGLGGSDIPEESRVLHAADALDHMTRPRAYRRNRPLREALSELAFCAGTRLDPRIARTLIDLVEGGKLKVEGAGTIQKLGQPLGNPRGRAL